MSRVLIDTNIYSKALYGIPEVAQNLRHFAEIGFSVISLGELLTGFRGGNREKENREELHRFLDSPRVSLYAVDDNTAEFYSAILNQLKNAGTPIPTNDIWIAATAFQHGMKVYTADSHFERIAGLLLYR